MIFFLGKKIGMSYTYNKKGYYIPLTVVYIYNCYIFKSFKFLNNYFFIFSYFSNFFNYKEKKKYFKKCNVTEYDFFNFKLNNFIPLNIFYINQIVNIFGISIGKGFSGVIKKHKFKSGGSSHGNSKAHNKPGSIGMCQDPGRVYRGKKMPGRLGAKKIFLKNLKILKIDFYYNVFYLKGSLPGFKNSNLFISPKNIF
ncbi:50S ribosomal protein L3 [Candidatus Nasuia deltocephalinicola]|uniref:50S ribosomal protein L3 n=1 Tax=Candidatus Nasuia deltocephalincola TaxID=1160784 RepID=UPI00216B007F|nr:50S ribosomal protein L3 [Candidatus Nasuia deltocephalinicola]